MIKFDEKMRKELCGDTYWLPGKVQVHLGEATTHDWDSKNRPTLKQVIAESLEYAYNLGVRRGQKNAAEKLREILGADES